MDAEDPSDVWNETICSNALLKVELATLKAIFPHKFETGSKSFVLSHSRVNDAAFTIHSDLSIFDQTWLSEPPVDKTTGLAGDWNSYSGEFPSLRFGGSVLPKAAKLLHGDPPLDLPFEYSHPRAKAFFEGEAWYKNSKIKLPGCFEYDATYGGNLIGKIALSEGLAKRAFQSAHGLFDLNSDFGTMLNELPGSSLQGAPCNMLVEQMKNLLQTNLKALRRVILYTSSCIMTTKFMAREIVLARFAGKGQLKQALQSSDFGTPSLFGPLNAEMQENVKMYRTHNSSEWRLTPRKAGLGKRKAATSLVTPLVKRAVPSPAAPLSSVSGSTGSQEAKKQYSCEVFLSARGKSVRKRRGGRGGQKR